MIKIHPILNEFQLISMDGFHLKGQLCCFGLQ